ncbi:MAG: ribonuclease 3 [Oligoflexia bacterium]|nr:MAG: ribonuclease 3 [Oligoflexia bacterium]
MIKLQEKLNYNFKNADLLTVAMTHKSYHYELKETSKGHNEKLEFLGDAVLDLVLSEMLMASFPLDDEGNLSKKRASLVNESVLSRVANDLGLAEHMLLGKGEYLTGGDKKPRLLASTYEALIGAIFQDAGFDVVRKIIYQNYSEIIKEIDPYHDYVGDFKTRLQEIIQSEKKPAPTYKVINEVGPAHNKIFEVEVSVSDRHLAKGEGRSKKLAEQAAAQKAIEILKNQGRVQ